MKCQEVMEYMQRHLDADLSEEENKMMQEHLEDCSSCAEMFERLNKLSEELVNLPKVSPPESIVDSILPRIEEIDLQMECETQVHADKKAKRHQSSYKRRATRWMKPATGLVAAILLVIVAIDQFPHIIQNANQADSSHQAYDDMTYGNSVSNQELADQQTQSEMNSESTLLFSEDMDNADQKSDDTAVPEQDEREELLTSGLEDAPAGQDSNSQYPVEEDVERMDAEEGESHLQRMHAIEQEKSGVSQEINHPMSLLGITPNEAEVTSPDGAYTAKIENVEEGFQVVIVNQAQEQIYASPMKNAELISNMSWSDDRAVLSYDVYVDEQNVHTYEIDVEERTEKQLQSEQSAQEDVTTE